jgi:hypothetical protein
LPPGERALLTEVHAGNLDAWEQASPKKREVLVDAGFVVVQGRRPEVTNTGWDYMHEEEKS